MSIICVPCDNCARYGYCNKPGKDKITYYPCNEFTAIEEREKNFRGEEKMTKQRALDYWKFYLERAEEYDDPRWERDERREHRNYIEALKWAVKGLENLEGDDG